MEKKLLIVEDDIDIANIIDNVVSSLFQKIDRASSQEEALKLLNENTYYMIFLDYNLDFKSGPEIIDIIKSMPSNPNNNIPVVLVSGMVTAKFAEEYPGKFAKIITKPFSNDEIIETVKEILGY